MKILLKGVTHEDKVSKSGKTYSSCKLTVWSEKEQKDLWISGFGSFVTKTWQVGDTVDVDLSQTDRGYWNFDLNANSRPSPTALDVLKEISSKLDVLIGRGMQTTKQQQNASTGQMEASTGEFLMGSAKPIEPGHPDYVDVDRITF